MVEVLGINFGLLLLSFCHLSGNFSTNGSQFPLESADQEKDRSMARIDLAYPSREDETPDPSEEWRDR